MGLFNKLKNALFEEEKIEVRPTEEKAIIKEDSVVTKKDIPVKEELPKENERDLFKAENTFKFPDFDEEEFVTSYNTKEVEEKVEPVVTKPKEPETRRMGLDSLSPLGYDSDRKSKVLRKEPSKREKPVVSQKEDKTKSGFRPSPVISPVYGVLDKNYKKEDIISVEEEKKKFNVDMARKKAFGTLEEDIEKTLNETPTKKFYDSRSRDIDDLLANSADATIAINEEEQPLNRMSRNKNVRGRKYAEEPEEEYNEDYNQFSHSVEQELTQNDENLEILDKEPKSKDIEEDTLESDLFDLIDSMYDNREEE